MSLIGIDLGGTKLALAVFSPEGNILHQESIALSGRKGKEVGALIAGAVNQVLNSALVKNNPVRAIGISVPGISRIKTGTVWAPNIPEWDDYPLLQEVQRVSRNIPVTIDCDRACYILGEVWKGNAGGCSDAIFLAVGTGIGAGILANGSVLRGAGGISGCTGWMALNKPFTEAYKACGNFEYYASGPGIARGAKQLLSGVNEGVLKKLAPGGLTAQDVFNAYDQGDPLAAQVLTTAVEYWGMAIANLVSLFNPEKIILGGGIFGPAVRFIPDIRSEAQKWAQPIGIQQVSVEASALGPDAGVYGAGYLALQSVYSSAQTLMDVQ